MKLLDQAIPAGYHRTVWNIKDNSGVSVPGGIYFYQIQAEGYIKTKKMVLLK